MNNETKPDNELKPAKPSKPLCRFCAKPSCGCYDRRVRRMTDKQLLAEVKRLNKPEGVKHGNVTLSTILSIVFESHKKGVSPFLR